MKDALGFPGQFSISFLVLAVDLVCYTPAAWKNEVWISDSLP